MVWEPYQLHTWQTATSLATRLEQSLLNNAMALERVLYMNLETRKPRGRPRNMWQDEVRENGRMVGGEEWQEKVYDGEE
jgi:hypothetical protein